MLGCKHPDRWGHGSRRDICVDCPARTSYTAYGMFDRDVRH